MAVIDASPIDKFRQISLASLRVDTVLNFDIYIRPAAGLAPLLFRDKNLTFTSEAISRLADHRHDSIYVLSANDAEYRAYVEQHLGQIVTDPSLPVSEKAAVVYSTAQALVADVLKEPRSEQLITRSRALVGTVTQFLRNEQFAFQNLMPLISYDYYTYTHSVNVYVFSVSLAIRAGFTDETLLQEFGEGVLLHDIGKSMIDPAITNCKGALSDEQWKIMKKHPVYGFDILKEQNKLSELALRVVRHHHEKIQGGGYPDDLKGRQIPDLVRVSTICDIFDALTTRRSYKPALQSFPALALMQDKMNRDLDPKLFRVFVEMMGKPEGAEDNG